MLCTLTYENALDNIVNHYHGTSMSHDKSKENSKKATAAPSSPTAGKKTYQPGLTNHGVILQEGQQAVVSMAIMPDGTAVRETTYTPAVAKKKDLLAQTGDAERETTRSIPFSAHEFQRAKGQNQQYATATGDCLKCGLNIKSQYLMANKCWGKQRVIVTAHEVFSSRDPSTEPQ